MQGCSSTRSSRKQPCSRVCLVGSHAWEQPWEAFSSLLVLSGHLSLGLDIYNAWQAEERRDACHFLGGSMPQRHREASYEPFQ